MAEERSAEQKLAEWEENAKYLLDSYPGSIRNCYKGGPEDLLGSMIITFIKLRDEVIYRK